MKILHVIPEFRKGGAERLAYDICYYLNQIPEIDVKLITFKENPLIDQGSTSDDGTALRILPVDES